MTKKMSQEKLDRILDAHEAWLGRKPGGRRARLCGRNVSGLNFAGRTLRHIILADAVLQGANLSGADLDAANFSCADMWRANAEGATFREANLSCADLSGANLEGSVFAEANLSGARLSGARIDGATWTGAIMTIADVRDVAPTEDFLTAFYDWKICVDAAYTTCCQRYSVAAAAQTNGADETEGEQ